MMHGTINLKYVLYVSINCDECYPLGCTASFPTHRRDRLESDAACRNFEESSKRQYIKSVRYLCKNNRPR
jgi:hypothetical protein